MMGRRRRFTDADVDALKSRKSRYTYPDPELPAHYVRVSPTGHKSFAVVVDNRWVTIGPRPAYTVEQSRVRAAEIIRAIRSGKTGPDSFEAVAAMWRQLHCVKNGLRSLKEIDRHLRRMNDAWVGRSFVSLKRSDVAKLLDQVELQSGTRQADCLLATFGSLSRWVEGRDDEYRSPVVKAMRRGKTVRRDRVLSDDEIRQVWNADSGQFGDFVRLSLLLAQRKDKLATMRWSDLVGNVWTIATETREKGNPGTLILPELAMDIITAQPRFASNPFVFSSRNGPISSWTMRKGEFDAKLTNVAHWTIHDLRRTARSLMSRAGIRPDIAERVLGHTVGSSVANTYDRHKYIEETAHALKALAGLIENILRPQEAKVARLRG
jgi:integrase